MIKKALVFIVETIAVFNLFVVLPGIAGYIENHYTREATVICVNDDEVVVDDTTGNEWAFYGTGYIEGDTVKMKMFTNYTDSNIYDDEIVDAKIVK